MSNAAKQSTSARQGVHNHGLKGLDDSIQITDKDYKLSFKRRRTLQKAIHQHIDDLLVERPVKGRPNETEMVRPLKSLSGCGFATTGFNSVKVKVFGDSTRVVNLSHCNNRSCPYCYLNAGMNVVRKSELALNGAFGAGYQVYFVTFTKEKIKNIEDSVEASREWMGEFRDWFKNHTRNRKIKGACFINLEFTIGTVSFFDRQWGDGNKRVMPLHVHNHAVIAIKNEDMDQFNEMKKTIRSNYVKFMKDRGIKVFGVGHTTVDGRKVEGIHWDHVTVPSRALARYVSKVERNLKVSMEVALSNAKQGQYEQRSLGLFQCLDEMEKCHWKDRLAYELTIARALVAIHGKGQSLNRHYNFMFQRNATMNNLGKIGFEHQKKGVVSSIKKNTMPAPSKPVRHKTIQDFMKEYSGLNWTSLVEWVGSAMAMPIKDDQDNELAWIVRSIKEVGAFHESNYLKVEGARVKGTESEWQKVLDSVINYCSIVRRPDNKNINMMLSPEFVRLLIQVKEYDELWRAIWFLNHFKVDNMDSTWKEIPDDELEPIGSMDVPSIIWNRLYGTGKAWSLVERIRAQVLHDAHPLLESQLEKCFMPHHIDDYVIVESEFDKLVSDYDL